MKAGVSVHNRLAGCTDGRQDCLLPYGSLGTPSSPRDTALSRQGLLEGRIVSCFSVILGVYIGPLDILRPQEVSGTLLINSTAFIIR